MIRYTMTLRRFMSIVIFAALASTSLVAPASGRSGITRDGLQLDDGANPKDALKKAILAAANVKSYRLRIDISSPGAETSSTFEYAGPGQFHLKTRNGEIIWLNDATYHKRDNDIWRKEPTNTWQVGLSVPARSLLDQLMDIQKAGGVGRAGRETIDGINTLVFQQHAAQPFSNVRSTTKLWLAMADGLPRRVETQYDFSSRFAKVLCTFSDYDSDIKIEPPASFSVDPPPQPPSAGSAIGAAPAPTPGGQPKSAAAQAAQAAINDFKPVPLNSPQPAYTEAARAYQIEGAIIAKVLVAADGTIRQVRITRGLPEGLDEEAIKSCYELRFFPALKDGQPVPFWQSVQIEFNLRKKK